MTAANNKNLFRGNWGKRKQTRSDGYRSKFEADLATALKNDGHKFHYEKDKIKYVKPVTNHTYTPDFKIGKHAWYVEVKGLFSADDRKKHLLIRDQGGPEIRFVFYNAYAKLNKRSKTTYADWCEKNGFLWSHKVIPTEWLEENLSNANENSKN